MSWTRVVLPLVLGFFVHLAWKAGEFRTLEPINVEKCVKVEVLGAEDIAVLGDTAYMGSGHNEMMMRDDKALRDIIATENVPNGSLVAYNMNSRTLSEIPLSGYPHEDFHPHGVDVRAFDGGDDVRLYVVNHRRDGDTVEIFSLEFEDDVVTRGVFLHSVKSDLFLNLNDVVAVGPNEFYTTIWRGASQESWLAMLETYLRLPMTYVVHCKDHGDGNGFVCVKAAEGLKMANGISASADAKKIYVMASLGPSLHIYDRNADGSLDAAATVPISIACDNLEVDPATGELYSGCHPKALTFVAYSKKLLDKTPSEVVAIHPETHEIRSLYVDDGSQLLASSAAARRGNTMLVGTVRDSGFLHCEL